MPDAENVMSIRGHPGILSRRHKLLKVIIDKLITHKTLYIERSRPAPLMHSYDVRASKVDTNPRPKWQVALAQETESKSEKISARPLDEVEAEREACKGGFGAYHSSCQREPHTMHETIPAATHYPGTRCALFVLLQAPSFRQFREQAPEKGWGMES